MKLYHLFDPTTRVYLGPLPSSGRPGVKPPDFSCVDAPEEREGYWPVRNVGGTAWEYVRDYRGRMMYRKDLTDEVIMGVLGPIPDGYTITPPLPVKDGFACVWDKKKSQWAYTEDHTGEGGYVDGEYVVIDKPGPLPESWTESSPEQPRREQILNELLEIDRETIRPLRADSAGNATEKDRERLAELDARAIRLREELDALPASPALDKE